MNAEKFYPSPPTEIVSEPVLRRKICVEVKHENQQDVQKAVKRMRGKREGTHDCDPKLPSFQPAKRSSIYRGVSRHRWTGRYEAHLWDKSSWNETRNKKGRQVYLGAYIEEEVAARTYDLAALKYWGPAGTVINFPLSDYVKDLEAMENITREEYLASLRRSSGFSRGLSKYRGVARHHQNDRWEARIGRVFGNKYLYLGTYSTQEEATTAYDMAAIEYRGLNAVTNFDLNSYLRGLRPTNIINRSSNTAENVETKSYEESMKCQSYTKRIESRNTCFMPCPSPRSSSSAVNTKGIKPSSTTALDLLLQSSRFKKMVQETSFENPDFGWDTKHLKSNGSADVIFSANQSNSDFPLRIVQNIESNVFPYYHEKVDDLFTCISNAQFQLVEQKHVSLDEEVCFAY